MSSYLFAEFIHNLYGIGGLSNGANRLNTEKQSPGKLLEIELGPMAGSDSPSLLALQATALQTASNPIMITDRVGVIKWINPAFTRLTGYDPEDVLEQNPRIIKSGQHSHSFYKELWGALLFGKTWHGEFTNRRKDGTLYHDEHTITPVRGMTGEVTHFVAIMADITDLLSVSWP